MLAKHSSENRNCGIGGGFSGSRIVDGDDPDWASWYAGWLLTLSELPQLLGSAPVRSHLVYALVELDRDYTAEPRDERWEDWYAERLLAQFGAAAA